MWYTIVLAILFYCTNRYSYEHGKEVGAVEMGQTFIDEMDARGYQHILKELFNEDVKDKYE